MATTQSKPTNAQRMNALEQSIGTLAEGVAALLANANGVSADPESTTPERQDASAKTAAKAKRVRIPTHTDREIGYRVEPDSKYKRYTLFTYLKDDGTDFKSVRVRTDILRDAIANAGDVVKFDPPKPA